jgi:hypothetical protein
MYSDVSNLPLFSEANLAPRQSFASLETPGLLLNETPTCNVSNRRTYTIEEVNLDINPKSRIESLIQKFKNIWNQILEYFRQNVVFTLKFLQVVKLYKWIKIDGSLIKGPLLGLDFSRTSITHHNPGLTHEDFT